VLARTSPARLAARSGSTPKWTPGRRAGDALFQVHRCELVLEWLMLYWRVRCSTTSRGSSNWPDGPAGSGPAPDHASPAGRPGSGAGRPQEARRHTRKAAHCPSPSLRRALGRRRTAATWDRVARGGRRESAVPPRPVPGREQRGRGGRQTAESFAGPQTPAATRRLAANALAEWTAYVKGDRVGAVKHLQTAYRAGPLDRRLLFALDQILYEQHDVRRRSGLFRDVPAELDARGDVACGSPGSPLISAGPRRPLTAPAARILRVRGRYHGPAAVRGRAVVEAMDKLRRVTRRPPSRAVRPCSSTRRTWAPPGGSASTAGWPAISSGSWRGAALTRLRPRSGGVTC